ncbi:MAG: ferredoxin reductase family protein [Pseudonocardiaceae bacterium]
MQQHLARTLWATAFVAVLLAPLLLGLGTEDRSSLMSRLSVGVGLLATSVLVCAVVLPSRLRSLTRTFGIEGVLGMHRYVGLMAAVLVLAHIALVMATDPANVALLDLGQAPGRARAATGATVALGALIGLTLLRRKLRHRYEVWRWVHLALAGSVLLLTALHIWLLDHLVRDPAMRGWLIGLALCVLGVLAYRWVWRPLFGPRREYVVREVRPETDTVSTLVLEPRRDRHRQGYRSLEFAAGQFAWLRLDSSIRAEEHPFTIASSAHLGVWTEFTIRHTGDFTRELRRLRPGSRVWVDGPHGAFTVDLEHTAGVVMIAAGVGITPMMSMLRTLAHRRDERRHRLVVVARTAEDFLFRAELGRLRELLNLTVVELLRQPPDGWTGATGSVDVELLAELLPDRFWRNRLDYFICGPPGLVTDALLALDSLNIPHPRIHTEQFDMV